MCLGLLYHLFLFLGLLAEVLIPFCLALPLLHSPSLHPGDSVSGSAYLRQNMGLSWLGAVTPSPFLPPSAAQPTRGLSITPTPGWAP